jgi:hypothetical protein
MTAKQVLAGERLTDGRREGRIGAVARNSRGELVAVIAKRIYQDSLSDARSDLEAHDLLTTVPLPEGASGTYQPRSILQASAALGQAVFRQPDDGIRTPGRVSALYGAVVAKSDEPLRIHGLLEVSFAETDERPGIKKPMPPIAENELGRLVMTYEGAGVGLIVGGEGHLAVVAPLYSFFEKHKLELLPSEFNIDDIGVGIDLLYNDLNQTPMLDLGEMPEAA